MVNVFYLLVESGPALSDELNAEIAEVAGSSRRLSPKMYDKLHKLDSVLRESQRESPPMILAMKRYFVTPYTFSNGFHAPAGTLACMLACAGLPQDDEQSAPSEGRAAAFDGLRSYRVPPAAHTEDGRGDSHPRQLPFCAPSPDILSFGYGKGACPGRFFASRALKVLFERLLTEYEFKYLEGDGPAPRFMIYEFFFRSPGQKMLMRRRT